MISDGVGKIFRDSKLGLSVQAVVAVAVGLGVDLLTDLKATAVTAIGAAAGLAVGWLTAKQAKATDRPTHV